MISREIVAFMKALDVSEIHGYRAALGLRVFTDAALAAASGDTAKKTGRRKNAEEKA